ncbi:hypothetical protein TRVA0_010S03092 [Trichomonascus vanleenenianus]|uniref:F-box protein n=1 Tax=Trichomonascus vanleenenianus TaxID=2268995 RepID=UPI003EC984F6
MSIVRLPNELISEIFELTLSELDTPKVFEGGLARAATGPHLLCLTTLSNTCKRFREVVSTNRFWKKACLPLYHAIGLTSEEIDRIEDHCLWYKEQLLLNSTVSTEICRAVYSQTDRIEILTKLASFGKRIRWPIIKLLNSTHDMTVTLYCKRLLHTVGIVEFLDELKEMASFPHKFSPMDLLLTVQSAIRSTRNFKHRMKVCDLFDLHPSILVPDYYDCPAVIIDTTIREKALQIHTIGKVITPDYAEPRMGLISETQALTGLSTMAHGIVLWYLAEAYHRVNASLIVLPFKTLLRLQSKNQNDTVYLDYLSDMPLLTADDLHGLCLGHNYKGSIEPASLEDIANHLLDFHLDDAPQMVQSLIEKARSKKVHAVSMTTESMFRFLSLKMVFGTANEKKIASSCMTQFVTDIWYHEPGLLKYISDLSAQSIQWDRLESNLCHRGLHSLAYISSNLPIGSIVQTAKGRAGVIVYRDGLHSTILTQGWGLATAPTPELQMHHTPENEYLHFNQDDLAEYFCGYDRGVKAFIPNRDLMSSCVAPPIF